MSSSEEVVLTPDVLGRVEDPEVFLALKMFQKPSESRMKIERVLWCTAEWAYRAQKEGPLGAEEIVEHLAVHHNLNPDTAKRGYLPKVLQRLARKGVPMR